MPNQAVPAESTRHPGIRHYPYSTFMSALEYRFFVNAPYREFSTDSQLNGEYLRV